MSGETLKHDAVWFSDSCEDVWITSEDGLRQHGLYLKNDSGTGRYVIHCHGFRGEASQMSVVAAVEDCGYTSVWDMIAAQAKVLHVPTFPVLNLTNFIAKNVAGYTLKEASSVNQLAHCKIPMLFFMARMTLSCRWPCSMRSMQLLNARSGASRCRGRLMRFLLRLRQNCIGARWGSFSPLGICDAERQAIRASSANKERGLYGDARCSSGDCCGRS